MAFLLCQFIDCVLVVTVCECWLFSETKGKQGSYIYRLSLPFGDVVFSNGQDQRGRVVSTGLISDG